jgi:diaminohydroxyphosphoribosylaminopyrimidine deaminase/5-amino-6-(5-phosphoribosylamino)uracil reductase
MGAAAPQGVAAPTVVTVGPADLAHALERALERALELGRAVAGTTAPNPPVGCVLVRDGRIVGEGATAPAGGPHAEVAALAEAGPLARGATAVVTLEPCAHTGRTGPCATALAAAGVTAVRWLVDDPNPVAAGGGSRLAAAGVDAARVADAHPVLAARAARDLRGFLTLVAHGRPHVLLKLAQDPAGRTRPPAGGYLTGEPARIRVHALRADVDGVLVGGATVRADDPRLDVRHVPARRPPRPVVLTATGDLPRSARLLDRAPLVVVGPATPADRRADLAAAGAEVVVVEGDVSGPDPAAALAALPARGVLTILAEPGPRLAAALLAADLVDEVELHVAGAAGAVAGVAGASGPLTTAVALPGPHLRAVGDEPVGADLVRRYVRPTSGVR